MALTGKTAIVTGGGRGIGRAMARGLFNAGANVVITAARSNHEIAAVALDTDPARVVPIVADVAREDDCAHVVDQAIARFGAVDILINNAGRGMRFVSESFMSTPTRFWETDPTIWKMVVATNVNGPFFMARAAVPGMIERGWGRIVNVSMGHETMRRRGFSPYGPSKAALESASIIWAQDLSDTGVTVNALLPGGATRTGMVPDSVPDAIKRNLIEPDIMVAPLLWLVSDGAAAVTGKRFNAARWNAAQPAAAEESAGWVPPA